MAGIRVLIVDDSAFMRHALGRLLSETGTIEVVGAAANGEEGLAMAAQLRPDVITLDVEMPVLDGLAMLKRLMVETPTRVVMLSSRTLANAQVTLESLEFGAIDFVPKPSGSLSIDIGRVGQELVAKIESAAGMSDVAFLRQRQMAALNIAADDRARAREVQAAGAQAEEAAQGIASQPAFAHRLVPIALPPRHAPHTGPRVRARKLVVIAASTGGPSSLHALVKGLPSPLGASVAIVQHMPAGFTASFAARLDAVAQLRCVEATNEDILVEDEIFLAPGDRHMLVSTTGKVELVKLPAVNGVRPAADVTLKAVAPIWTRQLLCVVMTGMGCDGREGARAVKAHGGTVFTQDAATATIYGMPASVVEAGLSDGSYPLHGIANAIARWCRRGGIESDQDPPAETEAADPPNQALAS